MVQPIIEKMKIWFKGWGQVHGKAPVKIDAQVADSSTLVSDGSGDVAWQTPQHPNARCQLPPFNFNAPNYSIPVKSYRQARAQIEASIKAAAQVRYVPLGNKSPFSAVTTPHGELDLNNIKLPGDNYIPQDYGFELQGTKSGTPTVEVMVYFQKRILAKRRVYPDIVEEGYKKGQPVEAIIEEWAMTMIYNHWSLMLDGFEAADKATGV